MKEIRITRRQVIAGAAALAAAAVPAAAPSSVGSAAATTTPTVDPDAVLLREIDRLFRQLRTHGFGMLKVETGHLAFWLDRADDMTSMRWAEIGLAERALESACPR